MKFNLEFWNMKNTIAVIRFFLLIMLLGVIWRVNAQDVGTGTGWGGLNPTEPLVVDENFQGFDFFHSDENSDQGNSDHAIDENTGEVIYNYKDLDTTMLFNGSTVSYNWEFYQCAFAPDWATAYAYQQEVENTPGVSDGFVEVSRGDSVYSKIPTTHGYVLVDLSGLESIEVIQYSHSSTGGRKRGILVEYSTDSGITWDTLRYQPGSSAFASSFTKDVFSGDKTYNEIQCEPSAFGMLWEDPIYWFDGGFMIRFGEGGGQTIRLHDLKVYGEIAEPSGFDNYSTELVLKNVNSQIVSNRSANISVYSITGAKVLSANNVNTLFVGNLKRGIYIVKAEYKGAISSQKINIQ